MIKLTQSQAQMIAFVLVDAACVEVPGLGNTFTMQLSKAGAAFAASAGTKGEIGSGWYYYTTTAAETNTVGPLSFLVTGAGVVQQNMVYYVRSAAVGCIEYTYTVTNSATGAPLEGVEVWVSTDFAGLFVVWNGFTDALGIARDSLGDLPCLDPGTYYFHKQLAGMIDDDHPDTEVVS